MRPRAILTLTLTLLLVAPALLAAPETAAFDPSAALELRLAFEFTGDSALVRLSDVATVSADPQQCWPELRHVVVARRDTVAVTRAKVLGRLAAAGQPVERVVLAGPAICKRAGIVTPSTDAPDARTATTTPDDDWKQKLPARLRGNAATTTKVRR